MSNKKDIFRAECDKEFDLPPCPHCGRKVHIEKLGDEFRVNHYCKGGEWQVRTVYCDTPEKAVELYLNGEYERIPKMYGFRK